MKKITMTKDEMAEEHKRLIPVLEKGSASARKKEAGKQRKEMKGYGIKMEPAYHHG